MKGIITVRTSSSRLPNKCLLRFYNSPSIIEYIINRSKAFGVEPIICTSNDHSDDIIEEISIKNNVKFYRGSLNNKISRWYHCAKKFNIDYFHNIDADDPFFDGKRMKESLKILKKSNFDYIKPSYYSDNGGASEGYSIKTSFLKKVYENYQEDNLDTEMITFYFEKIKNSKFSIIEDPKYAIKIKNKIPRLTLDYFEDYIFLNYLAFVTNGSIKRDSVESFLNKNKAIAEMNIKLNEVWKKNQLSKAF